MERAESFDARRLLLIGSPGSAPGTLRRALDEAGLVTTVVDGVEADLPEEIDLAILILSPTPRPDGLSDAETLRRLRDRVGPAPVLVACPREALDRALSALDSGAEDFITLPPDRREWSLRINRSIERSLLNAQRARYREELAAKASLDAIQASSRPMQRVVERIRRVAPSRSTVLISGESGVGKELVARSIHLASTRADRPFIALNCAAIPSALIESELFGHERGAFTGAHALARGKFEIAHGGTLFLDEIGEMELNCQSKLLRVLEEREFMRVGGTRTLQVDVRVIAATNAALEDRVGDGSFRRDLYYRLKVLTIDVPPLRERKSDVADLVDAFVEEICRSNQLPRRRLSDEAMDLLARHDWPGNVRELKNVIESVLVSTRGDTIELSDLPRSLRVRETLENSEEAFITLAEAERELIQRTLQRTGGNRTYTAELLGIGVRTLQRKIQSFGLSIPPKRRRPRRSR